MQEISPFGIPLYRSKAKDHQLNGAAILKFVENTAKYGIEDKGIKLSGCDWHVIRSQETPYMKFMLDAIRCHLDGMTSSLGFNNWRISEYWYQYYLKGDYHDWHVHGDCMFVGVYYAKLKSDGPKISFFWKEKEYLIDVEEGDVITFPSFLHHKANKNETDESKLILSFNVLVNGSRY